MRSIEGNRVDTKLQCTEAGEGVFRQRLGRQTTEMDSSMNKEALMKKTYTLGALIVAALIATYAPQANAATAAFPRLARTYQTWFARAMEPCTLSANVVSVVGANLPSFGCEVQGS